jgi:serine/threonine protein kinase
MPGLKDPTDTEAQVIGRYALFGPIAAGGMATVHLGRLLGPVGFSRTVAIKRLHQEYSRDPEFVSMFLDEARLAARIRHPNVVPTLDVVATKGELFLVMEYVQGESLSRLLKIAMESGEPVPPRITVSIMSATLQGLHAAHEARDERGVSLGIVHRDVSPQNVLVGIDGMSRVLDFGVAKAAGRMQTTREGQIKGKLAYMAPEQLQADVLDRKADVYAASVVLWEMLTNTRLFKGESEAMILARVLTGEVKPPSLVISTLSPAFDAVVLKGIARDPNQRYASAREMALELEKCEQSASLAEVATWIERVAGPALHERAMMISRIEIDSGVSSPDALKMRVAEALASRSDAPPAPEPMTSTRLGIGGPPSSRTMPEPPSSKRDPERPARRPRNEAERTQRPSEVSSISTSESIAQGVPSGRMSPGVMVAAAIGAIAVVIVIGFMRSRSVDNPAPLAPAAQVSAHPQPDIPPINVAPPTAPLGTSPPPIAPTSTSIEPAPHASSSTSSTASKPPPVSSSHPTSTAKAPPATTPKSTAAPANPFDLGGRN